VAEELAAACFCESSASTRDSACSPASVPWPWISFVSALARSLLSAESRDRSWLLVEFDELDGSSQLAAVVPNPAALESHEAEVPADADSADAADVLDEAVEVDDVDEPGADGEVVALEGAEYCETGYSDDANDTEDSDDICDLDRVPICARAISLSSPK